jgi:transcriptional regulator with XRE-family HTH domain
MGVRQAVIQGRPVDAFPGLLKRWRATRRLSQEQLAFDAEISARHLSYLETGKSKPSREMVLVLASALELELRERNTMLSSAGFAPIYSVSSFESLEMAPVRKAIELLLTKQEPYGAAVFDRAWNVLQVNAGAQRMLARFLPGPPDDPTVATNLVKVLLHPQGLRSSMVNWVEMATFTLERLERECTLFPHDEARQTLLDEVKRYPGIDVLRPLELAGAAHPVATVHFRRGAEEARFFTMLTSLGTPLDVTAQELVVESYFPADEATERWARAVDD